MEETRDTAAIRQTTTSRDTGGAEPNPPATNNEAEKETIEQLQPAPGSPKEKTAADEPKTFRFTAFVESWLERDEKRLFSDWNEFEGYKWRMLIFPKGNDASQTLSIYLECAHAPSIKYDTEGSDLGSSATTDQSNINARTTSVDSVKSRHVSASLYPAPWRRPASFTLILRHPDDAGEEPADLALAISRPTDHVFSETSSDWGFQNFAKVGDIRRGGYVDSRGAIRLEAAIKMVDRIDLYPAEWDSKKQTGFVGLKNQGATCYMNSLLQTLYMLGEFRRAVFKMPLPEDEDERSDISFALQKLFYELQVSPIVVKTKKLTESFGWDTTDAFTQHDAQELNRILCDHLEEKLKKSKRPNTIAELFEGKILNFIECVDVDYKSRREESFYDLSLNVKGCRDISESFDKYTEVEMMDGDNKYRAEGFTDLQKAKKGVKFTRLPPVLQLHLKRFEYDFNRDTMVKINDRYEFSKDLDLSRYVEQSDNTDKYFLHSVLVHIGDVNGGHYHAYIRPSFDKTTGQPGSWYKFDDDQVRKVTAEDAIQSNFGAGGEGDDDLGLNGTNNGLYNGVQAPLTPLQPRLRPHHQNRRFSNAYMLQYVRKNCAANILREPTEDDVPNDLFDRITREKQEEERRRKERAEQHLYTQFKIATDRDLTLHYEDDLVPVEMLESRRVKRTMTLGAFKSWMEEAGLIEDGKYVRVWHCKKRDNGTYRPYWMLADGNDNTMITEALRTEDRLPYSTFHYSTRQYGYQTPPEILYVEDLRSEFAICSQIQDGDDAVSQDSPVANMDMMETSYTSTGNGVRSPTPSGKADETSFDIDKNHDQTAASLADDEVLIFFKLYIPSPRPQLRFLGHAVLSKSMGIWEVKKLLPRLFQSWNKSNSDVLVNAEAKFKVWEEVSVNIQTELGDAQTLRDIGPQYNSPFGGDILVFQLIDEYVTAASANGRKLRIDQRYNAKLPLGGRPLPLAPDFYDYLRLSIKVDFRDKDDITNPVVQVEILRSDSYKDVRKVLASALDGSIDSNRLRFFGHDGIREGPRSDATHLCDHEAINQMLTPHYKISNIDDIRIIWYEHTEYDIREFNGKEEIRITWRPDGGAPGDFITDESKTKSNVEKEHDVDMDGTQSSSTDDISGKRPANNGEENSNAPLSPKDGARTFSVLVPTVSKYGDVLNQVRLKTKTGKDTPLRLMHVKNCKVTQVLDEGAYTQKHLELAYDFGVELRAEPIPADQTKESLGRSAMLVPVVHVTKDKGRRQGAAFGVPILLRVNVAGETIKDLRERIRKRLGVSEKEFSTWRLGETRISKSYWFEEEDENWIPSPDVTKLDWNSLLVEHKSNAPMKRPSVYNRFADKPLKIRS